ncbi:MAG: leucine-rich repeat domain-containing protein [Candidatus Woesearchaeota archaeon]
MKSQTSTEYLTLFGVIIVIVVILLSFFGGFGDFSGSERSQNLGLQTAEIGIRETAFNDSGVGLIVQNNRDRPTIIQEIQINGVSCTIQNSSELPASLRPATSVQIFCRGNFYAGSDFSFLYVDPRLDTTFTTPGFDENASRLDEIIEITDEFTTFVFQDGSNTSVLIVGELSPEHVPEENLQSVIIGTAVTSIADSYFESPIQQGVFRNRGIESIHIPDSVTSIGQSAFGSNQISSLTLPENINTIPSSAFSSNSLTEITIPDSVQTVGIGAFANNQIESITFSYNLEIIERNAFQNNNLISIDIPQNVAEIGMSAFQNNDLISVTFPDSVTYIGNQAFRNNELTEITLPSNLNEVRSDVFRNNNIETVILPPGLTHIRDFAFQNNNILEIELPSSLSFIGLYAFETNNLSTIRIPGNTQTILSNAFANNANLERLYTEVGQMYFDLASNLFANTNLQRVYIDPSLGSGFGGWTDTSTRDWQGATDVQFLEWTSYPDPMP